MKTTLVRSLVAVVLCGFAANLLAGPFRSAVIPAGQHMDISVPDGVYLHVRNFTQEGGSDRGVVTVTMTGQTTSSTVLAATIVGPQPTATVAGPTPTPTPTPSALEPINTVFIAGPATVTVTAGDVAAFITYKKEHE